MKRKKPNLVKQIKKHAAQPEEQKEKIPSATATLIPTGSTLLNMALSENPFGGFPIGKISNVIGDSWSGKTFLALTALAECATKKRFDEYDLFHDNIERSEGIDIEFTFGKKLAKRIQDPESHTFQDFKKTIFKKIEIGTPFIYVLDSLDGLTTDEELVRMEKEAKGKVVGSFKTEKARGLSEILRIIKKGLGETNSHLCIISQVRDNMDQVMFGPKFRRTGGRALKHWSSHELWLFHVGQIKREVNKIKRQVGNKTNVKISKNRITGKIRDAQFSILNDYGVDDLTSCIEFMTTTGAWPKGNNGINAKELGIKGTVAELIEQIENKSLEKQMKKAVGAHWMGIERSLRTVRKKRFQ